MEERRCYVCRRNKKEIMEFHNFEEYPGYLWAKETDDLFNNGGFNKQPDLCQVCVRLINHIVFEHIEQLEELGNFKYD